MDDILQRLRDLSPGYGNIIAAAIAEIESLRARVAELEDANYDLTSANADMADALAASNRA